MSNPCESCELYRKVKQNAPKVQEALHPDANVKYGVRLALSLMTDFVEFYVTPCTCLD
jgi:hypothetical protein